MYFICEKSFSLYKYSQDNAYSLVILALGARFVNAINDSKKINLFIFDFNTKKYGLFSFLRFFFTDDLDKAEKSTYNKADKYFSQFFTKSEIRSMKMNFLKNNKRFSFRIGTNDAWETPYQTKVTKKGDTLTTVYLFENGLKVTNMAKKYEEFGAYEWCNHIENTSEVPSEIISELWDCDYSFPLEYEEPRKCGAYLPDFETSTRIYAPSGSNYFPQEFFVQESPWISVYPGDVKRYSSHCGRSSQGNAPFFNVHKNGKGYIFAVGWTGQWFCEIKRNDDSVTFRSKINDTYFRLLPGEKIRTSSVVVLPYAGDVIDSQNQWRRLVKKHFSLIGQEGRDKYAPFCASVWGGMKTQSVLDRISAIKKNDLPFEYIWMDAGWYGHDTKPTPNEFESDWSVHTGDWIVSPYVHPQGLKDVSAALHEAGMKFLLWFEPERVIRTTPTALEHPEYFLSNTKPNETDHQLLNLGNPDAWNYCFETLSKFIDELKIDCYRQDFNFEPLDLWRKNDPIDRKGITEIKHINGLYKLWDALLEKFPHLIIDNCASGGRRIDIETLKRSVPLWRSDIQCPANYEVTHAQCHHFSFNMWLPYSGTGTGRLYDEYRIRSAYDSAMNANYSFSESEYFCDTEENILFLRKYMQEYLKIRPYFSEDYYPLTKSTENPDVWAAAQFNRPSEKDGIIQIFRRENSPYERATFILRGLNEEGMYLFTDIDGGEFTVSGKELSSKGLTFDLSEKQKAKIYFYKEIDA